MQRGFKVYSEVCAACHGIRHISYRDLEGIGYSPDEIKVIAAEYEITDGPNDEGDMFTREAKMSDKFVEPYENETIARLSNNGSYPPDLSLIVKARAGGADYIYSLQMVIRIFQKILRLARECITMNFIQVIK